MECLVRKNGSYLLAERETPTLKKGQILVRVSCASLNRADFAPESFMTRGKTVGSDISGTVVGIGEGVAKFALGDPVLGVTKNLAGGCAEYALVDSAWAEKKPATLPWEGAAALPSSSITAWAGIRKLGNIKGKHVLVLGASGGVGQYATLLLSSKGAVVTAACGKRNLDAARENGAFQAIDYQQGYAALASNSFDAIVAVNGTMPASEIKRLLAPKGILVILGTSYVKPSILSLARRGRKVKVGLFFQEMTQGSLRETTNLLSRSSGKANLQIIDGLDATCKEIPLIAKRHPSGKVVVRI